MESGAGPAPPDVSLKDARGKLIFWPLRNSASSIRLFLAALLEGVVPVLLPPGMPAEKLAALQKEYARFGTLGPSGIAAGSRPAESDARLLFVLLTSGSTGKPKLVAATAEALEAGLQAIHKAQSLEKTSSTAVLLPLSYSYALVNQLLWAVRFERILMLPPLLSSPADAFEAMQAWKTEMLCLVGSQARFLHSLGFSEEDSLPAVETVNFAGAPFPVKEFTYLKKLFPNASFYNNYGCTEALPRLTVCKVKDAHHSVSQVGMPLTGIELRIAGSEEIGPVEFRGKSAAIGEVTPDGRVKEYEGWIRSGDMGRLERGTLHVFGRYDQVCNIRGERTSLLEIEGALLRIPKLSHALVWAAVMDGEEVPLAVLGGEEKPSPELLREHLKSSISRNAWPVKIFWADPWPLTDNQKTDRVTLQEKASRNELSLLWELRPQAN